jgi:DNA-directed RNA polymerase specialized sigma24 family protein
MAGAGRILVWWDRDVDPAGRPIRRDVRLAGHEIWEQACQRTQALLDDHGAAAELMENSVAQVSRYLDRIGAPESSQKHGLLMVAFCRGLRRYAAKVNRLEFVGGSGELASRACEERWVGQINARLELARIVRKLGNEQGAVLMLRAAGYEWEDVGQLLGKSAAAVRISFWREIKRIRSALLRAGDHPRTRRVPDWSVEDR